MILSGPSPPAQPERVYPALVYTKAAWDDEWTWQPEIRVTEVVQSTVGDGVSRCTVTRPYGMVKHPWEAAITQKPPFGNGANVWVRVTVLGEGGEQLLFIGRIQGRTRNLHGVDTGPSGVQTWHAEGPASFLRRIAISQAFWLEDSTVRTIDWVPDVNRRTKHGVLRGNRSATVQDGSYVYTGTATLDTGLVWTNRQYLDYIVSHFLNEDAGGPEWTVSGQVDILDGIEDVLKLGDTQTAADVLEKLIPRQKGLDYYINATADGFEIVILSLNSRPWTCGSATLHSNPAHVSFTAGTHISHLKTTTSENNEQQYRTIRVLGRRVVLCASLCGSFTLIDPDLETAHPNAGSLMPLWDSDLETEYLAGKRGLEGGGWDPGAKTEATWNDEYRATTRFLNVFQQYAMPLGYDMDTAKLAPFVSPTGEVSSDGGPYKVGGLVALDWIPLRYGFSYATSSPTAYDDSSDDKDIMRPVALVTNFSHSDTADPADMGYRLAHKYRINVSVLDQRLGVFLSCNPNHLLALDSWSGAEDTNTQPKYDHEQIVATLAWEADERFALEVEVSDDPRIDGVRDVMCEEAQLWWLAPNTAVGINEDMTIVWSPSTGYPLRNDLSTLQIAMAGALARYSIARGRASIELAGTWPWAGLVGRILDYVETAGERQPVEAPITLIAWTFPDRDGSLPQTTIRTGYA